MTTRRPSIYSSILLAAVTFSSAAISANYNLDAFSADEQIVRQKFFRDSGTIVGTLQSGNIHVSCCGEADAYEADEFELDAKGNLIAILTCNDPRNCEAIPNKVVRAPGTRVPIPMERVLVPHRPDNNTGHGWVFLGANGATVYCYSLPAGG